MDAGLSDQAEALLDSEPIVGHLATCRDGRPHAAPVWYVVRDGHLEVATTGQKLANLERNPRVAFSAEKTADGEARWGVSVQGRTEIVQADAERRDLIRRVNRRYGADDDEYRHYAGVVIDVEASAAWEY